MSFPTEDITPILRETISSKKIRLRSVDYALGFNEFKNFMDVFLQKNNFSQMEIRSIYHLINSYYFMGSELDENEP